MRQKREFSRACTQCTLYREPRTASQISRLCIMSQWRGLVECNTSRFEANENYSDRAHLRLSDVYTAKSATACIVWRVSPYTPHVSSFIHIIVFFLNAPFSLIVPFTFISLPRTVETCILWGFRACNVGESIEGEFNPLLLLCQLFFSPSSLSISLFAVLLLFLQY